MGFQPDFHKACLYEVTYEPVLQLKGLDSAWLGSAHALFPSNFRCVYMRRRAGTAYRDPGCLSRDLDKRASSLPNINTAKTLRGSKA